MADQSHRLSKRRVIQFPDINPGRNKPSIKPDRNYCENGSYEEFNIYIYIYDNKIIVCHKCIMLYTYIRRGTGTILYVRGTNQKYFW